MTGRFDRTITRAAQIASILACVWFALAAAWGMFGKIGAGHYAAMTSEGIMAENMWRWGIFGPVWSYVTSAPGPESYYCHHPWGLFWITALFYKAFGHHDFILALPAVLMSAATPVLLYKTARQAWGVVPAAAATCGFVVLPITVGFANFHALEVMVLFGWSLFFWGYVRMLRSSHAGHLAASLLGLVFAVSGDWPGYIAIGVVLCFGMLRSWVLPPRLFDRIWLRRHGQWWVASAALAAASLLLWVMLFNRSDKLGDWLGSAQGRGDSEHEPLAQVLASRSNWIETAFSPLAILIGKVALPIAALRLLLLRRDAEILSLAVWVTAVVQYVVFKKGADVHFFWPHYFALYYAIALAQLVATARDIVAWGLTRLSSDAEPSNRRTAFSAMAALCLGLLPAVLLVPDAVWALRYARETGGRFNEKGNIIRTDMDLVEVAAWLGPQVGPQQYVEYPPGFPWGWHAAWQLRRPSRTADFPSTLGSDNVDHPFYLLRASMLDPLRMRELAASAHIKAFGDLWVIDTREAPAPVDSSEFVEREPGPVEWYLQGGVFPQWSLREDPWSTWEWRVHLGQAGFPPSSEPQSADELRVAYNAALGSSSQTRAAELRARIAGLLDLSRATSYNDGSRILGARVVGGVHPRLETWIESGGPSEAPLTFSIRSLVEKAARFSLIPVDPVERDCAYPPSIPTTFWQKGFLYKIEIPIFKRRGRERFFGFWSSASGKSVPARDDGSPSTELAVLE